MLETRIINQPDAVDQASQARDLDYTIFSNSRLWDIQRQYFRRKGLDAWAAGQVPHYATSHPNIAKAYAQVVLGFWRDLKSQGKTIGHPLYIIELGAGSGRFAYHFMLQFFAIFDAICAPGEKVCYVMTDFSADTVNHWQRRLHPKLHSFVEQGRLDFAVFDAETDTQLELQHQKMCLTPNSLGIPPVVIANSVFDGLRQDLFFLEKDRLYEGWVALTASDEASDDQPFSGLQLTYQKRRIVAPKYQNNHWNQLIQSYAERLPPCALLFPSYVLNTLERLSQLHRGNLLLLSADRGSQELKELASQQEPDIAHHSNFSVVVNYHSLVHLVEAQGGSCWVTPAGDGLAILAACWRAPYTADIDGASGTWRETALAAQLALQGFNPNDFYRIKQTLETEAQYLSPEQMLAFLRLSQWDTKVFYLMYPYIYDFLAQLPDQAQKDWYQGLIEVWRFHLPIGEDYDLAFDLACLAAELNRWSAAIDWFLQSLEHINPAQRQGKNLASIYFNIGIAHWQTAAYSEAETYLLKVLAPMSEVTPEPELADKPAALPSEAQSHIMSVEDKQIEDSELDGSANENDEGEEDVDEDGIDNDIDEEEPDNSKMDAASIRQQLVGLQVWLAKCQQLLGAHALQLPVTSATGHKTLYASLLGPHQAQALYRLQRDPELCQMAGVECLQSIGHAQEWIEQEQCEHKHVLAILHPDFGLIGVAALECPPHALTPAGSRSGRFYYWVGKDYQHQGYGGQAMTLLHQLARIKGVQHIFSMVEKTNMASQRALAKLGYKRLSFEVIGEQPSYRYHHLGRAVSEQVLHSTLNKLLVELGNGTSLAPLTAQELA
jgi:RimJ/RimL family protein N-acetyltransferase